LDNHIIFHVTRLTLFFVHDDSSSCPSLPLSLPKLPIRPRNMLQQQEFLPDKARYKIKKKIELELKI